MAEPARRPRAGVRRRRSGYAVADHVGGNANAAVDGFAAGALLVMLIDSMIPQAVRQGDEVSGLVTVLGFAVAAGLSGIS